MSWILRYETGSCVPNVLMMDSEDRTSNQRDAFSIAAVIPSTTINTTNNRINGAMRSAVARLGKEPKLIEPLVPVDLVVDHSVQVDFFGSADAILGSDEDRRHEVIRTFAFYFLTPVTATETIDRWMHIRNTHVGDEAVAHTVDTMFRSAFAEDKVVLEAIQREEEKPQAQSTLRLAIDQGPIAYRARIQQLVESESS